jgi:hypothetical protein
VAEDDGGSSADEQSDQQGYERDDGEGEGALDPEKRNIHVMQVLHGEKDHGGCQYHQAELSCPRHLDSSTPEPGAGVTGIAGCPVSPGQTKFAAWAATEQTCRRRVPLVVPMI